MVGETLLETCNIGRGVRQGCSLSPSSFILYDEAMVRKVCCECVIGIRVGGKMVAKEAEKQLDREDDK